MAALAALQLVAPTPPVLSAVEALQAVIGFAAAGLCLRTAAAGTGLFRAFWAAFGAGSFLWALAAAALTLAPRSPDSVAVRMTSWVLLAGSLALMVGCAMRPDRPRGRLGVAFDAIILAVLVLQTWLYFTIPDVLEGTRVSRAWLAIVSDARAALALTCCALLVYGARGRWRRTVTEMALALVVLFVGGALSNRAWAAGLYRPGLWDLPWTLSFAWIGLVAHESRHMAVPSTFRPDWRELRRSSVVAVIAMSFAPALEFVITLILRGERLVSPRAEVARAVIGLAGTVTLAVLFALRQFRIIGWAQIEQKERDGALRASEERLSKVFRSSPDSITVTRHRDGLIVAVNQGFERITGFSAEEAVGRSSLDLLGTDRDLHATYRALLDAAGRVRDYEFEFTTKAGARRLASLSAETILIDGEPHAVSVARDITDQRTAEGRLRESEEHLRLALDAARMATWEWNVESGALSWSGGVEALLGSTAAPDTPESFLDLVHPTDRATASALVADLAAGRREEFQAEYRLVVGDQVLWVEGRGRVERDANGRVVAVRGAIVDVTRRKAAEESAHEGEERWKRLSEATFEGIGFSERGQIIDVNQQLADMLGYPPEALLGRPVMDIVAPASRPLVQDLMKAGTIEAYEHLALRSDGSTFPVEVRGRPVLYQGRPIRVTAVRDMSERERLEAELRQAAREWQESFEALSEGITIVDEHGEVRRMNRSALSTLGLAAPPYVKLEELASREPWAGLAVLRRTLRTGPGETREVRDLATGRWWLLGGSRLPREEGPDWTVLTFRDITETAALREQLERGAKLAAMGSLVAGVAHEVRTPLFSISATLDAFEGNLSSPHEQREFMGLLRSQVVRLTHLMSDLLDYGRPPTLHPTRGDLSSVVRQAVRACRPLVEGNGVQVLTELADDLPRVARDSARLEQVFHNLLANAIQHSPRGATVRLSARVPPDRRGVELSVEDEGPGLAATDVAQVFEPFFSRRKGGTGLGLSIVQRLVEGHGGTVSAANRSTGGAAFTVWLPTLP